ncbi:hypothetical protein H632_c390p1 [Helicosporidium sp. ATCC 50920]|nr:hypothetical protein H632_c390p1 [Helicosporidium sp. ATCC 50920]|eukprot:KDD76027.1 hypothetical protein H632_c390p1 [Helicosporidium sp. ATCC 50920]
MQGQVKQIVGSTLSDETASASLSAPASLQTNFVSSQGADWYARLYASDGLEGGHVIMLGADSESQRAARSALLAAPGRLQLGGSVTADNARSWIDAGAAAVIVTSYVFRNGTLDEERLRQLVRAVGKDRLVLDLSCKPVAEKRGEYVVMTDRWQRPSDLIVCAETLERLASSCCEFLVHAVDVEGLQAGVDADLVRLLGKSSPISATYAGGARTLEDLDLVATEGQGQVHVTVGSALDIFGGALKYADVLAWHRRQAQTSN